jgi:Na+/proline symporter
VTDERRKVQIARAGVLAFGVAAYVLALRSEGVFALVEEASAFGSAGALVTVTFALFTRVGGVRTASATLVAGVVSYLAPGGRGSPTRSSLARDVARDVRHGRGARRRAGARGAPARE